MVNIEQEAMKLSSKGSKLPKVTVTKIVKTPEDHPRFVHYYVKYAGRSGEHTVSYPIDMFKDEKEILNHISLVELYRRSRTK